MQENITGMQIYYYMVCKRKLWYYSHSIQMESNNENVMLGKILDENSYSREDKHININNVINIDYIKDNMICETKKSKKIEQASIMQLKYYLYYLKKNGAEGFIGELNFPALKQKTTVTLEKEDKEVLEDMCSKISVICSTDKPPEYRKKGICRNCAYYDLCAIV